MENMAFQNIYTEFDFPILDFLERKEGRGFPVHPKCST